MALIKAEGIDKVTIRKIASAAEANVALVNYYFGSKEKLISETLKLQLASFQEAFSIFDEIGLPPLERLKRFLLAYTSSLQEHPELIKRVLGQERMFESQLEYASFLKSQGFDKLGAALTEIIGPSSREKLLLVTQQLFAAILSPIVKASFSNEHKSMQGEGFVITASVEEQIDLFLDHYFYKYTAH
ncbi:TetR/AcrR family transcriptional regulator [Paenibacillus rhizovicinus]|uniref:TetR/AcrR family transcriptional regulator n=1 Tax=Paenibacillus rhizovicinus TaxID=2704463 RepID=A0A6C0NW56_9BACL|nr:TetR/AcrR family transcriptional regulator [Paenibacillus rhizovicinus]